MRPAALADHQDLFDGLKSTFRNHLEGLARVYIVGWASRSGLARDPFKQLRCPVLQGQFWVRFDPVPEITRW